MSKRIALTVSLLASLALMAAGIPLSGWLGVRAAALCLVAGLVLFAANGCFLIMLAFMSPEARDMWLDD